MNKIFSYFFRMFFKCVPVRGGAELQNYCRTAGKTAVGRNEAQF